MLFNLSPKSRGRIQRTSKALASLIDEALLQEKKCPGMVSVQVIKTALETESLDFEQVLDLGATSFLTTVKLIPQGRPCKCNHLLECPTVSEIVSSYIEVAEVNLNIEKANTRAEFKQIVEVSKYDRN